MAVNTENFLGSLRAIKEEMVHCQFCREVHFGTEAQAQEAVCPKCVYDPRGGVQKSKRYRVDASGNLVHLHSSTNDMDPFYVHESVVARHNQYGLVENTELVDEIQKELCALPALTLVEKCMISLATPIMTLGRVKRKGQGQTFVGNCISIRQDITAVAHSVLLAP